MRSPLELALVDLLLVVSATRAPFSAATLFRVYVVFLSGFRHPSNRYSGLVGQR